MDPQAAVNRDSSTPRRTHRSGAASTRSSGPRRWASKARERILVCAAVILLFAPSDVYTLAAS